MHSTEPVSRDMALGLGLLASQRVKRVFIPYANMEDPDWTAYLHSLTMALSVLQYILQYLINLSADIEGPNQTVQMRSLIRAFVALVRRKVRFLAFHIISHLIRKYRTFSARFVKAGNSIVTAFSSTKEQ